MRSNLETMVLGNLTDLEKVKTSELAEALSDYRRELSPKNGIDFMSFINKKSTSVDSELNELNDDEIIDEIKNGNYNALNILDFRYREDLLKYSRNMLKSFDFRDTSETAKDIVQDTFMKSFEVIKSGKLKEGFAIKNYFMGAIYKNSKNYIRQNNHKKAPQYINSITESNLKITIENIMDNSEDRFSRVVELADISLITKLLYQLDEKYKNILMYKLIDNKSWTEISNEMGISDRTRQRYYKSAKQSLKSKIEAEIF